MEEITENDIFDRFCKNVRESAIKQLKELIFFWKDLWDPEEIKNRTKILEEKLVQTVSDVLLCAIEEETKTKLDFSNRLEALLDEIAKLSQELSVKIPFRDVETLPFHTMAVILNERAGQYRTIREARVNQLSELLRRGQALESTLGKVVIDFHNYAAVPSEKDLESLNELVQSLAEEKCQRMALFLKKRESIISTFARLGTEPVLNFERKVVSNESIDDFVVTDESLAKVEELLSQLKERVTTAEKNRNYIVSKLRRLWELLEKPITEKEAFLAKHAGITRSDITALNEELEKLERERSSSIGKLVLVLRKQLVEEWNKCLVDQKTRDNFQYFDVTTFNDDIYDLHELELSRWKSFYSENAHIFELYERHQKLFDKLVHLSGQTKDNNSRFQNRGGQLLKEERERKAVAKDLPRVEEQLRTALAKYQETNGTPFTHFGVPLVEKLDTQWLANFDQKLIDKFHATSTLRTPLATKRPANTPSTTGGKMQRLAVPGSTPRAGPSRARNGVAHADDTTYAEFEKPLIRKENLTATRMLSVSTENLTVAGKTSKKGLQSFKSTPNMASPKWTKPGVTPKTIPRAKRQCSFVTPARKTKLKPIF